MGLLRFKKSGSSPADARGVDGVVLPPINERVAVIDSDGNDHRSRVENHHNGDILLAAMRDRAATTAMPDDGAPLIVCWATPRGLVQLPVRFVRADTESVRVWRVRPYGASDLLQRRNSPRVETSIAAQIITSCGAAVSGTVIDISESGLRVTLRHAHRCLAETEPLTARFQLAKQAILTETTIRRASTTYDGLNQLGLEARFSEADRRAVRTYVWDIQRRLLLPRRDD